MCKRQREHGLFRKLKKSGVTKYNMQGTRESRARPCMASLRNPDLADLSEESRPYSEGSELCSNGRVQQGKDRVRFTFGSDNKLNWRGQD